MSENAYVCPYCHSENIQSYNIAYAGGFSNVNGVTTGVGIGAGGRVGVGIGNTVGTQQTVLSMMAKPPMKKSIATYILKWWIAIQFGLVLLLWISGLSKHEASLIIYFGAYALLIYKTYQRYVWNRDTYPVLRRDWEHTYVCLRCGNSFLL